MRPTEGREAGKAMAEFASDHPDRTADRVAVWLDCAIWGFIALGVLLRVVRYALNFPLWSDEAFVAANFLTRDYLGLLRPLDYGQICPVLFLWAERSAVGLLGFSEYSLRLFPLVSGVAGLLLFRRAAGTVVRGLPLLLAVGVFAISSPPARYASEVKPYASDLLAAVVLLAPALAWLSDRERTARLWALAAVAPLALGLSHPAVFVAGGVSVGIASAVWRTGRRKAVIPFLAFNLATAACFLALYVSIMRGQAAEMAEWRESYWGGGFPPLGSPVALARWLIDAHTGKMLAYPGGGDHGASTPTFLLAAIGAVVLWRQGRRSVLAALLGPFALTFLAAALHKYPYGGEARHMQYVAPAVCLLMAVGTAALIGMLPRPSYRLVATCLLSIGLIGGGVGMLARYVRHPFTAYYDVKSREFARRFWPALARDAEIACLVHDFGLYQRRPFNMYTSFYLCNQMIYSPPRDRGRNLDGPRWEAVSADRPLRCVLFQGAPTLQKEVHSWLTGMTAGYELRRSDQFVLDMANPGGPKLDETITIFEFVPRPGAAVARSVPSGISRR
jgi:hypothetical protein